MKMHEDLFHESWMEENLSNGLKVSICYRPMYTTSVCLFGTDYGSLDNQQKDNAGNRYHFPSGTAHFLEHKLFESDHGDAMNDFSSMGANVNAFTSYEETIYYFDTAAEDIRKPLNLLMDMVQNLSITEESVEREKNIILQERGMYMLDPDDRLELETMRSMYRYHPYREDIVGSAESIRNMRKKDLEGAYALNYHPSRMRLVCLTHQDPELILELIEQNQKKKKFSCPVELQRDITQENREVERKYYELSMDISAARVSVGFKIPQFIKDNLAGCKKEWGLRMMLDSWFTSVNPLYQTWLDEKQISPIFSYDEELGQDASMLMFYDETDDAKGFLAFIQKQLDTCMHIRIPEDILNQLKKRNEGAFLHNFNQPMNIALSHFSHGHDGFSAEEEFRMIEGLSADDCMHAVENLDLNYPAVVNLLPRKK